MSGNDPEAQVVAFVLQVCSHEDHETGHFTSKFTFSGNESWKIVSCIKPDVRCTGCYEIQYNNYLLLQDTVFQLISAPTSYIAVDLVSKATTVSLRCIGINLL